MVASSREWKIVSIMMFIGTTAAVTAENSPKAETQQHRQQPHGGSRSVRVVMPLPRASLRPTTRACGVRGGGWGDIASSAASPALSFSSPPSSPLFLGLELSKWHLAGAVTLDMAGTALMKRSEGMRPDKWPWTASAMAVYMSAYACFGLAMHRMPLSVCYAYFQAFGTLLASVVGAAMFRERMGAAKVACLALVVVGVVGLELVS